MFEETVVRKLASWRELSLSADCICANSTYRFERRSYETILQPEQERLLKPRVNFALEHPAHALN